MEDNNMLESKWKAFYDESKKPYSSEEEFTKYCEDYSDYVYQSPHIQECLEFARNSDEFLKMIRQFEDALTEMNSKPKGRF